MKEIPTIILVVALALIGSDGRVLMQRRRADRQHGGLWEFPGGKVEPGEAPETALIREIAEELGVTLAPADLRAMSFASGTSGAAADARPLVILLYTCCTWAGEVQNLDAEEVGWFEPDQFSALQMPPLDVPLAKKLAEALK